MSPADTGTVGVELTGAGFDGAPETLLSAVVSVGADWKITPRNINTVAATAAQIKMTRTIIVTVEFFAGGVGAGGVPKFITGLVASRLVAFEPFMINSTSSPSGACGTMILWKHVGHSIIELLRHNSHLICCPQTGQTNLNSLLLMLFRAAFHIRMPLATGFFNNFFLRLCD
jgi:hypothetical protein